MSSRCRCRCRSRSRSRSRRPGCTDTFLGERLRRLSRRLGGNRARCAVARSILVIIWHLLANPETRYADLGADWHARKGDRDRKIRAHVRQLQALGLDVTITPAA
jgi:transposase